VNVLRRLSRPLNWLPHRGRPVAQGWPNASADPLPGINVVAAGTRPPAPKPHAWVTHPINLDIGEIADGYHLIARSISLSAEDLLFEFAFAPERTEGAEVWLNMSYTADVPVSQDYIGAGDDVQYARPPRKARYAWFDFFRTDYDWMSHSYSSDGQPDSDYVSNRIARLTFDLKTGEAQVSK
jgi:hypothetical protein